MKESGKVWRYRRNIYSRAKLERRRCQAGDEGGYSVKVNAEEKWIDE
jgi:hypothetical protein